MFGFEKLDVWQRAIDYSDNVYCLTRTFPSEERFGLTSQLRRSAVSVSSNIAEGSGRPTGKDFSRFLQIGYGSLMESVSQAHIAKRQGMMAEDGFIELYTGAEEVARMLSGLRRRVES